jgi:hypothetical protein
MENLDDYYIWLFYSICPQLGFEKVFANFITSIEKPIPGLLLLKYSSVLKSYLWHPSFWSLYPFFSEWSSLYACLTFLLWFHIIYSWPYLLLKCLWDQINNCNALWESMHFASMHSLVLEYVSQMMFKQPSVTLILIHLHASFCWMFCHVKYFRPCQNIFLYIIRVSIQWYLFNLKSTESSHG